METVTIEEVRAFAQVGGSLADTVLTIVANGAEEFIRKQTGVLFTSKEVTDTVAGGGRNLWPSHGPIDSITEIKVAETGTVKDSTSYRLVDSRRVLHEYGRWYGGQGYWTVVYTAGFTTVPDDLKMAVLQLAARWYENRRGAESEGAAGHDISYRKLAGTDVWNTLEQYEYGEPL